MSITTKAETLKVYVVTDPMCSWCWGMTPQVQTAVDMLADRIDFDLLLGGINTDGSQPIGDYGRQRLFKLWDEVRATTSQEFGYQLPTPLVYNSTVPCMAVRAVSQWMKKPAFEYLHRLQKLFFLDGQNINDHDLLADVAMEFGWSREELLSALNDLKLREVLQFEFETSRSYGTNALPSLLWEKGDERTLLAGGYLDSSTLVELVEMKLAEAES